MSPFRVLNRGPRSWSWVARIAQHSGLSGPLHAPVYLSLPLGRARALFPTAAGIVGCTMTLKMIQIQTLCPNFSDAFQSSGWCLFPARTRGSRPWVASSEL